jgi:hypothetical protein
MKKTKINQIANDTLEVPQQHASIESLKQVIAAAAVFEIVADASGLNAPPPTEGTSEDIPVAVRKALKVVATESQIPLGNLDQVYMHALRVLDLTEIADMSQMSQTELNSLIRALRVSMGTVISSFRLEGN